VYSADQEEDQAYELYLTHVVLGKDLAAPAATPGRTVTRAR
jgi:hypothetical protein